MHCPPRVGRIQSGPKNNRPTEASDYDETINYSKAGGIMAYHNLMYLLSTLKKIKPITLLSVDWAECVLEDEKDVTSQSLP